MSILKCLQVNIFLNVGYQLGLFKSKTNFSLLIFLKNPEILLSHIIATEGIL